MDISELDNPAWAALTGRHAHLAIGEGPVRRYPAEVSPFAALETPSALPVLTERMAEGETAVLWSPAELEAPADIELVVCFPINQMAAFDFKPADVADDAEALDLTHVDEMIALTTLMKPGPFGARTIEMGSYIGIHEGGSGSWPCAAADLDPRQTHCGRRARAVSQCATGERDGNCAV